ncbi:hypothetical protein BD324DRAFT_576036 [Kockovaella imperatae]|uniref:FAD-binding domain-containing protein n=1 Tax=Kockovaella imperatae TaxID=4999 RepID=A0A1Y1UQE2_9TREE|nr:hypothetical protein BD324DRAFT_576036 [Kockovaella imperatae]ORX39714.1 hypothetical protein BD324DRAFT_576036 [Kockovaella imperatae]
MSSKHVIIVGGGLAGPALAIALARQSIRSTILERHASVQDIGGVIMLAPNAMCVMDKTLGLSDQLRKVGTSFDAINIWLERGGGLSHVGGFSTLFHERSSISIGRPVLHQTLMDECEKLKDKINIRFSSRLRSINEGPEGVEAILEDGHKISGDILIGADGIGSKVRQYVLGETIDPTYSGIFMTGMILPKSEISLPPSMSLPVFSYTRHGTFLIFDMGDGNVQWVTSFEAKERDRKTGWAEYVQSGQAVKDVKLKYGDLRMDPIKSMVDKLSTEHVRFWAPYLMPPLERWHTDRVCMIGDAAHAIPPSAGQGAAQAFEDIGLLSRLLGKAVAENSHPDFGPIFERFEKLRRPRIDQVRTMTVRAEATRRETSNGLMWWLKGTGTRAVFWLLGKNGYLSNEDFLGYDVNALPL